MARFSIKKKDPRDNGWSDTALAAAQKISGGFDPMTTTHHQFIEELVSHHLSEISKGYKK